MMSGLLRHDEWEAVLRDIPPRHLRRLAHTYMPQRAPGDVDDASFRDYLIADYLRRGGFGRHFLAEVECLAPNHRGVVAQERATRQTGRSFINGAEPVALEFRRGKLALRMWSCPIRVCDPEGTVYVFLLVSTQGLEGRPELVDHPQTLLATAPREATIGDLQISIEAAAIDRELGITLLQAPEALVLRAGFAACDVEQGGDPQAEVVSWVLARGSVIPCHISGPPLPSLESGAMPAFVMPAHADDGVTVTFDGLDETLHFSSTSLVGFFTADRFLARAAVCDLARRTAARRSPVLRRLRRAWSLWRGGAAADSRFLDWLYPGAHSKDAGARADLIIIVVAVQSLAAAIYLVASLIFAVVVGVSYGLGEYGQQVRIGLGFLVLVGIGVPTVYGVRASGVTSSAVCLAGFGALVISVLCDIRYSGTVAGGMAGALFGAIASTPTDATEPAGVGEPVDLRRLAMLVVYVLAAALVCVGGFALTQWYVLRSQPAPLATALALLMLTFVGSAASMILRRRGTPGTVQTLAAHVALAGTGLSGLIWLGIAWASDPWFSGLLEGCALGGLATVLVFWLAARARTAPATQGMLFWMLLVPCATVAVLKVLAGVAPGLKQDRWFIASIAFVVALLTVRVAILAFVRLVARGRRG